MILRRKSRKASHSFGHFFLDNGKKEQPVKVIVGHGRRAFVTESGFSIAINKFSFKGEIMSAKGIIIPAVFLLFIGAGLAWAGQPVAVSPGDAAGTAISNQTCPTFSWSSVDGAVSYRLELYDQVTTDVPLRDAMNAMTKPVSVKDIAAPALSWTPSSGECLTRGTKYIWYVRGASRDGAGQWSEGRAFLVEAEALSAEQRDAVQEVIKEYLAKEAEKAAALSTAGANREPKVTITRSPKPPACTDVSNGLGVRTAQTVTTPVEVIGDLSVQGTGNLIVMGTLDIGYEVVTNSVPINGTPGACPNYANQTCYFALGGAQALCSAGKKVIAGGCYTDIAYYDANINRSYPNGSHNGWICGANSSANTGTLYAYAICARMQ